jgi:hypothetical protein
MKSDKQKKYNRAYCKAWRAANPNYMREYRRNNQEHFRQYERDRIRLPQTRKDQNLQRLYGVSLALWNKIFDAQGRRCAICGSTKPNGLGWSTDHNHKIKTKHVRGILCSPCNVALGMFRDSVKRLRAAINYLEADTLKIARRTRKRNAGTASSRKTKT